MRASSAATAASAARIIEAPGSRGAAPTATSTPLEAAALRRLRRGGTAPQAVLRFLAAPTDVNWDGRAHGGNVCGGSTWLVVAAELGVQGSRGGRTNAESSCNLVQRFRPLVRDNTVVLTPEADHWQEE